MKLDLSTRSLWSLLSILLCPFWCDFGFGYKINSKNHVFYSVGEPILVGPDQIYNGRVYKDGQPLVGTASNIIFDGDVYLTTDSEVMTSNLLREHHPVLHLFSPSEAIRKEVNFFGPKKVVRKSFKKVRRAQKKRRYPVVGRKSQANRFSFPQFRQPSSSAQPAFDDATIDDNELHGFQRL